MSVVAEVTTIIRTYNRCDRTLCAIESAINQSLTGQPIVVVDDGSTDNVAEAINKQFGSRVAVIRHNENKGVGAAANTGLAAVETPYAAFLDSDDVWEEDFLKSMLLVIKDVPGSTLAYCDMRFEFPEHDLDYAVSMPGTEVISRQLMLPPFTMSSVMLRVRSARAVGSFRTDKKVCEDTDYFMRMWLRVPESFVHLKDELVRYRMWSGNITNDLNCLINEMDNLMRQYIRHPYFSHLKESYSSLARQRLLGVAARHQVLKWLRTESKRTLSLVITNVDDADKLARSLKSAACQRLPPLDVAIVIDRGSSVKAEVEAMVAQDWPFSIQILPVRPGSTIGERLQYSLNVLFGSALVFLQGGEEFSDGALDAHRHALSCSPKTVLMTYGGTETRIPDSLPNDRNAIAVHMVTHGVPISLSTICLARKFLVTPNIIPKYLEEGFFQALVLSLLVNTGPIIRIAKPVVRCSNSEPLDRKHLQDVLRDLSESDFCHDIVGAFDQILDQQKVADRVSCKTSGDCHG